jgi:hypothetical protein
MMKKGSMNEEKRQEGWNDLLCGFCPLKIKKNVEENEK